MANGYRLQSGSNVETHFQQKMLRRRDAAFTNKQETTGKPEVESLDAEIKNCIEQLNRDDEEEYPYRARSVLSSPGVYKIWSSRQQQVPDMLTNINNENSNCFTPSRYDRRLMFLLLAFSSVIFAVVVFCNLVGLDSITTKSLILHGSASNNGTHSERAQEIIGNRCREDNDMFCTCGDPLVPVRRDDEHINRHEYFKNKWISNYVKSVNSQDIVFLGDSITENMLGCCFVNRIGRYKHTQSSTAFEKYFSVKKGGLINGLALGIAGDQSPHLLWRIQNGELPEDLNPKVFWLLIGINDLAVGGCNAETVVIGILGVAEEILKRKPASKLVINGILPFSANRAATLGKQWERILVINKQLRHFSEKHEQVDYFDVTHIFVEKDDDGKLKVNTGVMPDRLHPNHKGEAMWFEKIVERYGVV